MMQIKAVCFLFVVVLLSCSSPRVEEFEWVFTKPEVHVVDVFADVVPVCHSEEYEPPVVSDVPRVYRAYVRVTACSPQDRLDRSYYSRHGYKGAAYNVCSDYNVFPRGTQFRVPGYMQDTYPGRWWSVDAPGGVVIRRSTFAGVPHIDVKYRTTYSARKFGNGGPRGDPSSGLVLVEFVLPAGVEPHPILRQYLVD